MAARCQTYLRHFNSTARSSQGSESTGTSTVNTGHMGHSGQTPQIDAQEHPKIDVSKEVQSWTCVQFQSRIVKFQSHTFNFQRSPKHIVSMVHFYILHFCNKDGLQKAHNGGKAFSLKVGPLNVVWMPLKPNPRLRWNIRGQADVGKVVICQL